MNLLNRSSSRERGRRNARQRLLGINHRETAKALHHSCHIDTVQAGKIKNATSQGDTHFRIIEWPTGFSSMRRVAEEVDGGENNGRGQ
jgi:hypothetical protein